MLFSKNFHKTNNKHKNHFPFFVLNWHGLRVLILGDSEQLIPFHHFHATHEFTDIYHTPLKSGIFQSGKVLSSFCYFLPFSVLVDLLNFSVYYILSECAALKGEQSTDLLHNILNFVMSYSACCFELL